MMPYNQGFWEIGIHAFHQFTQAFSLLRCADVSRLPVIVHSTFIADADAVAVMSRAVRTHFFKSVSCLNVTIPADNEMIANRLIASDTMPAINVESTTLPPRRDSRAMDDNDCYSSHLTQLVAPNAVNTAMRMLITVWMANLLNSLFFVVIVIFFNYS